MPELPAAQHRALHRNKRTVSLDLKRDDDRERARDLALRADVVIESHRPGVMARHGLDGAALSPHNPGLVHLSLPGFASADTERAGIQAWEGVVAAAASLLNSDLRRRLGFPPLHLPAPVCSAFASMHGAIAVVSALVARERSGRGTTIEVPLVNAGISACSRSFIYDGGALRAAVDPDAPLPEVVQRLALMDGDDDDVRAEKQRALEALAPPIFTTHHYRTSDGKRLLVMPIKPEMAERFFRLLGLDETVAAEGFVNENPWAHVDVGHEANVASSWTMSRERSLRLIGLVQQAIGRETADHWQAAFASAGIPVGFQRTRAEWLATPSLFDAGLLVRMSRSDGALTVPGRTVDVTGPDGAPPAFAANEAATLSASQLGGVFANGGGPDGPPRPDRAAASDATPPCKGELLRGVKVLDLCNVVAGPNAAYTLAQLGADVVRVEPPKSFNLPMHLEWTLEVNQGKRSAILDIGTAPGRAAFEQLVRWADVVVHNRLDDVAERLGMSAAQLQAIAPDVVVCRNTAYGGPVASAWDGVPGYDPMPNLATGLDAAAGTPDAPRGMTEIFADLMGGLGTGFAAVLGLYQRARTGFAGAGHASLLRGAHHYQFPHLVAEEGSPEAPPADGRDRRGEARWHRSWACRDGWIFVGARAEAAARLAEVVAGTRDADETTLARAFAAGSVAEWCRRLREADIGCHPVVTCADLCADAKRVKSGSADERSRGALEVLRWTDHPSGLPINVPAPEWVLVGDERTYRRLAPAARVGAHTREVLRELDLPEAEIERLYALRIAHDFLPAIGSVDRYFHAPRRPAAP